MPGRTIRRIAGGRRFILQCGVFLFAIAATVCAQPEDPCTCTGTDPTSQYRTRAKHRKTYTQYTRASRIITPSEFIDWQNRYADRTDTVNRSAAASKLRKLKASPEDTLYTLQGFLYYIKKEEDCDYHMEIGPADPAAQRAVVELTKEFCSEQRQVRQFLIDYVRESKHKTLTEYNLKEEFNPGIPVTVKGLGFYDGWHGPDAHGRSGTHGSSWELHPAVRVEFDQ